MSTTTTRIPGGRTLRGIPVPSGWSVPRARRPMIMQT